MVYGMTRHILFTCLLVMSGFALGKPTEMRQWTSAVGTTLEAKAIELKGKSLTLTDATGRTLTLQLEQLSAADQEFIIDHFAEKLEIEPASDLAHPLGQTVGPLSADGDTTYHLYLPKSLVADRQAPVLIFTSPMGGKPHALNRYIPAAELTGMVLAVVVESRNGQPVTTNHEHCMDTLNHIGQTLPVNIKQVIFSGGSGGAATAMFNAGRVDAIGAIPYVGYLPNGSSMGKKQFFFAAGGVTDFNRYGTAEIARDAGDRGVHRLNPGGHTGGDAEISFEGLIWVYSRHIYSKSGPGESEVALFEHRFLPWLKETAEKDAPKAYFWVRHLLDSCDLDSDSRRTVEGLESQLKDDRSAVAYHAAWHATAEMAEEEYSAVSNGGSRKGHTDPALERAGRKLLEQVAGVPEFEEIAKRFGDPSE